MMPGADGYLPPLNAGPNAFPPSLPGQDRPKSPGGGGKQSKLTTVWTRVMDLAKRKQYEEAYRLCMKEADDLYLLRLLAQTGPVVK